MIMKPTVNCQRGIIFICLLVHLTLAQEPNLGDAVERCATSSQIDLAMADKSFSKGIVPDDPVMRSYLHCVFTGLGLQDPDGTIRYDLLRLNEHGLFEIAGHIADPLGKLTKCESMNIHGATPDETLFLNFKCFVEH